MTIAATVSREVKITAEPIDGRRCRFVVDRPIYPGRWALFAKAEEAERAELPRRLFAIEGARSVLLAHDKVTMTREVPEGLPVIGAAVRVVRKLFGDRSADLGTWLSIGARVGDAIRSHLSAGGPAVPDPCPVAVPPPDRVRA